MDRDLVGFFNFWLWEYQRRNSEYKHDYLLYINDPLGEEKFFIEKHKRLPRDYNNGFNSGVLLEKVISGGISYSWPIEDSYELARMQISYDVNEDELCMEVDLNDDVDIVMAKTEMAFHYTKPHYVKDIDPDAAYDYFNESRSRIAELAIKKFRKRLGKDDPLPKAVGLWLWDEWKRGVTQDKAAEYFRLKFHDSSSFSKAYLLESDKSSEKFLTKKITATARCIESVQLLPIK